jgi:hypothetical protein
MTGMNVPDPDAHAAGRGLLPEPVEGTLRASAIVAGAAAEGERASGLPDAVEYLAYEAGDLRFAWLHAVPTVEDEGPQFFALTLQRDAGADGGWSIADIDDYDSPEDAKIAAGRMWVKETQGRDLPTEPIADW